MPAPETLVDRPLMTDPIDRLDSERAPQAAPPDKTATTSRLRLLPHELVFGFFLALTFGRLAFHQGIATPQTLVFLGLLLANGAVILWAARRPSPWRWRLRLLFYPALMGLSFATMASAIPLLGVPSADPLLLRWDAQLFGLDVRTFLQSWRRPPFTDVMMAAYLFFFYYLIAGPAHYCIRDLARFRECFVGLFTLYGLGFISYTFVPAGGPWRVLEFAEPIEGVWLTRLALSPLNAGSNGFDVFPSLHVGVSFYLLVFDWWHHRRRFWWVLLPCVALGVSTVYLRYHYFVDLLAGVLFALIGLAVARAFARSALARQLKLAS